MHERFFWGGFPVGLGFTRGMAVMRGGGGIYPMINCSDASFPQAGVQCLGFDREKNCRPRNMASYEDSEGVGAVRRWGRERAA